MKRDDLRAFLAEKPYDAMVLTSEISRRYATGFHSTAGAVYLSAKQAVFFTDFRYAEAARAAISDFEVREIRAGQSYSSLINGLIEEDGAKKVALEDKTLTYAEFMSWSTALHATAVRLEDGVESLRMMKEDSEVEKIVAAQRIAEQALEEVLNDIRIGVTEKEIAARLTYLMLHYGAENMSFDPIVVSGANSSKPHGVPTEKTIEAGDFVTMDFGCIYDGYCSDMTRTAAASSSRPVTATPSATASATASVWRSMRRRRLRRAATVPSPPAASSPPSRASISRADSACASRICCTSSKTAASTSPTHRNRCSFSDCRKTSFFRLQQKN